MKEIITIILTISLVYACQTEDKKGGLLWEISGNGLEKPSYLFATWHGDTELRNASFLDSVHGFHTAFASAEQFIYEGGYRSDDISHIFLPKDTTYAELLSKREILILDSVLNVKLNGASSSQMNLRPMNLAFTLSYVETETKTNKRIRERVKELEEENRSTPDSLFYKKRNALYAEKDVMDIQLSHKAEAMHLPLVGLDSIIQFDLIKLNLMSLESFSQSKNLIDEAKELMKSLTMDTDSMNNARMKNILPMRIAYRAQDIEEVGKHKERQLESVVTEEITKEDIDKFMQIILTDRNKKWMQHLPSLIHAKPSFIAVGAAHLPYDVGLISLLRKEGYTATPVTK